MDLVRAVVPYGSYVSSDDWVRIEPDYYRAALDRTSVGTGS